MREHKNNDSLACGAFDHFTSFRNIAWHVPISGLQFHKAQARHDEMVPDPDLLPRFFV